MRFRTNIENVATFRRVVQAIEKLQKRIVLHFSESALKIICAGASSTASSSSGGVQVWSDIAISSLFSAYRIQSNANNEITMAMSPESLLATLRSAEGTDAEEVTMKLAKKNDWAVLSFEISGSSKVGRRMRVTHDVRIEVLKPSDAEKLKEPQCPEPDVHIVLPSLQKLRTVTERLRLMSDVLGVRANRKGKLVLSIGTDGVRVDTTWTDCVNPVMVQEGASQRSSDTDERDETNPEQLAGVLVSVRSFLKFLNSHVVSTATIAAICSNHCLIIYVYIGSVADAGGVLTFYIPAIIDDENV